MSQFQTINAKDFDPIFDRIGKEWMLISASDGKQTNTMTASWGFCGILWNKPVAVCLIRPQRHTFSIVESTDHLSLSFLGEEYRDALTYCGRNSGRDGNKFKASGLTSCTAFSISCIVCRSCRPIRSKRKPSRSYSLAQ